MNWIFVRFILKNYLNRSIQKISILSFKDLIQMQCTKIGGYTASQKHESTLLHTYRTNIGHRTVQVQQKSFEKPILEVDSSHLYASFGTVGV